MGRAAPAPIQAAPWESPAFRKDRLPELPSPEKESRSRLQSRRPGWSQIRAGGWIARTLARRLETPLQSGPDDVGQCAQELSPRRRLRDTRLSRRVTIDGLRRKAYAQSQAPSRSRGKAPPFAGRRLLFQYRRRDRGPSPRP